MAYDLTSSSNLSAEFKQFYDKNLLEAAKPSLLHNQFGQSRSIPARNAKSIEFRKFSLFSEATTALTEGTPPTNTNLTVTKVNASVSQYGAYVIGTDEVETQAFDSILDETTTLLGQQMGNTMDILTRNKIAAGTYVQYGNGVASYGLVGSGNYMDSVEIRKAVRALARNNAPKWPGSKFYSIIHPDCIYDMKGDSTIQSFWVNGSKSPETNPLFNYEVGEIFGVKFFETTNAKVNTSIGLSGADIYCTLVFGQNAYGVLELEPLAAETIYHPRGEGGHSDPLDQAWTLGWKASHTAVILDQTFIQRIETTASYHEAA